MSKKVRLLIVDDEVKFLNSIAQRLEMRNFEVAKAANGQEAIDAAKQTEIDIALLDLKMPGLDGCQVLKILKEEHAFLEVIILTGHGSLDFATECKELGAFSYLPKPYELDDLLEILKDAYMKRFRKKYASDFAMLARLDNLETASHPLEVLKEMLALES
ncbi:MAG: response regulator [Candidatus Omnitrophota bacterium]|nr:MAG: response regulator [Candidatus Omnitrophota bacterium]